jgi:nicotinamidase-related amidase
MAMPELVVGKPALLVIDMQHDFLDSTAGCYAPGAEAIVPRIGRVVEAARRADVPVIFTQEAHRPGRIDSGRELDSGTGSSYPGGGADAAVPEHCVEGTRGIEIVDELTPLRGDLRIVKRRYSCFLGTELELLLRNLGVSTLLITGVDSNVCVLWTVGDAFQRDYHVRVVEDCVAGSSPREHEAALTIMRSLTTGERRVTSADVVAALERERERVEA